jgi:PAS domain S-box-containing protein
MSPVKTPTVQVRAACSWTLHVGEQSGAMTDVHPTTGSVPPDGEAAAGASSRPVAEEPFRALIERTPVITYTEELGDTDTYSFVSPQIEPLLGYNPEEIVSQSGFLRARVHPDDLAQLDEEDARSSSTGEPFRLEYRLQARDGRWVHVQDAAVLVRDDDGNPRQWQGVLVAVTEQRQAEAALRLAESRYRDLFDEAPVMYAITRNEDGTPVIEDCNALFLTTLGYGRDEVIGRSLADFYGAQSREQLLGGGYAAALAGTLPPTERQLLARDGSEVDVLALATPDIQSNGKPRGTRISFVDISERKAVEAELHETAEHAYVLMETALDCVVMMDGNGIAIDFNATAERTFGFNRGQVIGRLVADTIIPPEFREAHTQGLERFLETGEGPFLNRRLEITALRADGTIFPIELSITPVASRHGQVFVAYVRDISDRVAIETALRASEERFRALVQWSYDIITVVDRDGVCRYVSPSIEHILGYAPEELVGHNATELVQPDDAPLLQDAIEQCLAGARQTSAIELCFRHRDGGWRDFESVGVSLLHVPGVDGIVFNSRDITARKGTEKALRESEERFRAAFQNAPIGLSLITSEGRFQQVNPSLCALLGYDEPELLRLTFQEITHPDDLPDDLELAGRLWAGEIDTYQIEKRYVRKDGHPVWVEQTVSAVQEDSGPRYALSQIQDVTDRRNLDLERATMLASERAYTRELRDLSNMRADLSRMVAHELRAPVSALRMMASTVATGALAPEVESEMMAAIHGQIDQLDRLITDVAATAAAEREDFAVQLHPVPLAVLVSGAAAFARTALGHRPFTVVAAEDVQVWCDPERISQVLHNLLDNIAKHTPPDTAVELRATVHGNRVRIEVADEGPGIPADDQSVIFQKFARGQDAADRQTPGAGLGLYLSHQIVEAHGAELTVRSAPGGGTVFSFDLRMVQ